MNISYLITCSNETTTLSELLSRVQSYLCVNDELIIILDSDCQNNQETKNILSNFIKKDNIKILEHALEFNYSNHKNWGISNCKNQWIMQLDGDELPTQMLLENIKTIIEANTGVESYWIPRTNAFIGVTTEHAKKWGWKLSPSTSIVHEKIINKDSSEYNFLKNNDYILEENENLIKYKAILVNAYDYQCRLFLNIPDRIKWIGRLHERIEGNDTYSYLPPDEELSIIHNKSIEKQIETNLRYNKLFTQEENKGFNLPK